MLDTLTLEGRFGERMVEEIAADTAVESEPPPGARLLVLEDDDLVRRTMCNFLKRWGFEPVEASNVAEAVALAQEADIHLAVVDYSLPDGSAFDFLKATQGANLRSIILTGHGTIDLAVQAMKLGAEHFLTKPVDFPSLRTLIHRVLKRQQADRRLDAQKTANARSRLNPFLGRSGAIAQARMMAEAVAGSDAPVLILGETGTGKGVLAKWLHEHSPRQNEPFVDLNCAGLSRELAESDLFGHQKGAFTGAAVQKKGLLEVAHRGALFMDEIGDLDAAVQPKLLKVLEEKLFRRVGDIKSRPVDVRLIAATHRDLEAMAASGEFRQDLLYRINTVTFHLPALRDRKEDIPLLADTILAEVCSSSGRSRATLSDGAVERLLGHSWPGNLREMRNVLERALLFNGREELVMAEHILITNRQEAASPRLLSFDEAEKELIVRALSQVGDKVDEAAKLLDVPRSSLYKKIKRYGIRRA